MLSGSWTWRALALLLAGVLLRLLFLYVHPPFAGDSLVYADLATNLLQHHVYGLTEGGQVVPTLIRLPGYPAFLAVCFALFGKNNFLAALWIQLLLSVLDGWLLALLARRLMGQRAGFAALALAMLCPFTANYSATALTETWSLFCMTLAFFALERWTVRAREGKSWSIWLLPLTFALTFAVLLRPDRSLLAAVIVPAMVWSASREGCGKLFRRFQPAACVVAALLLPLALWSARNWHVFHVVQPLAPKYANDPGEEVALGFQRWYRTWAIDYRSTVEVYWPYDGSFVDIRNVPSRAFDDSRQRVETERLFNEYNQETSSTPAVDDGFAALAQQRVSADPLRYYLLMPLARLADMWLRPRTELLRMPLDWWEWRSHPGSSLFSTLYAALNAAYLCLATFGLRKWAKRGWRGHGALACAMIAFVLLRCALLMTLDNSEQRYTIECYPIVLLLVSFVFAPGADVSD